MNKKIALIGDYNESVTAHRAIPLAIELVGCIEVVFEWIHIDLDQLFSFSGFWCVPASPYANMENVLAVIKFARVNNVPFLGTCGGYQHAALEFARNELGYAEADNAEVYPETKMPLISALSCKLYNVKSTVQLIPDSLLQHIYSENEINEEYFCGYGINVDYLSIYEGSDLMFSGFDIDGDPRALEIRKNTFFIGTAFQPERSALACHTHPLVSAFVRSVTAVE